jgi:CspA family cold shock protein
MKLEIENTNTGQEETQILGTVKWFNNVKGYGFIRHTSGQDVFVHYSVIADEGFKTLNEGDEVIYELDTRVKGLFAKKVQKNKIINSNTIQPAADEPLRTP